MSNFVGVTSLLPCWWYTSRVSICHISLFLSLSLFLTPHPSLIFSFSLTISLSLSLSLSLFHNLCCSITWLTNCPVLWVPLHFFLADDVPDAGQPVSQYGEHGHEQSEHHERVLGVAFKFLHETGKAQQTGHLEQVYESSLKEKQILVCWPRFNTYKAILGRGQPRLMDSGWNVRTRIAHLDIVKWMGAKCLILNRRTKMLDWLFYL